ncbi:hypothetical protein [Actinomyces faecalis]|uniref:hypothetical protein n=1 Tax=Actinomyces faecalis TaxID=2722820 RepID=UPI0015580BC2|nr:hypothetical protein [Actinomyces faecalis]
MAAYFDNIAACPAGGGVAWNVPRPRPHQQGTLSGTDARRHGLEARLDQWGRRRSRSAVDWL